jgi:glyoxylase-like metal-dependent hydrolase (beta-lactamase superfamily II)
MLRDPAPMLSPPSPARLRLALLGRQLLVALTVSGGAALLWHWRDGRPDLALSALSAPWIFGVRHALLLDPAGLTVLILVVICAAVLAASLLDPRSRWGHRWGWAILLWLALGHLLCGSGARAGTGLRSAIPWEGAVTAPPTTDPCRGCVLHVFQTGTLETWAWTIVDGGRGMLSLPALSYAIQHPAWGLVVIDPGPSPDIARDPARHVGALAWHSGAFHLRQRPGQDLVSQIRRAGLDYSSVPVVALTHPHPDHAGATALFADAQVSMGRADFDGLRHAPRFPLLPSEFTTVRRFRPLAPGQGVPIGAWGPPADLLGDGTILAIPTPGHTPGHMSYFLQLPKGPVLLAGDVAMLETNLANHSVAIRLPGVDTTQWRQALGQLEAVQDAWRGVIIVPGHDAGPLRRARRPDLVVHGPDEGR